MNSSRKVCLLGSSFGTNNFGVNVLTLGTVQCLLDASGKTEISILDYGREPTVWNLKLRDHSVELPLFNIRFSKKPWQPNHIVYLIVLALIARFTPFSGTRKRLLAENRILQHLSEMDIITAISGGDSFSDLYGLGRFFYVSLPQILVVLLRQPLVLLPQTYGPFRSRISRSVARYILRHAERVYSRDAKGVDDARELLGSGVADGRVQFSYDVGFVVDPVAPAKWPVSSQFSQYKKSGPVIGLNVSGLLFKGGYSQNNMFGLRVSYPRLTRKLIDFFLENEKATLLLVPHVFGAANYESDAAICLELYNELRTAYRDRLQLVQEGPNEREIKYLIGQCDFFVGARMHACIAALSQSVPTVPIAYSDKFIGVMKTIGVGSLVADPRVSDEEQILSLVRSAYENRLAIRMQLEETMPEVRRKTLRLFRDLPIADRAPAALSEVAPEDSDRPAPLDRSVEPLKR